LGKFSASLVIGVAFVIMYYIFVALISLIVARGIDPALAKSLLLAIMYAIGAFGVAILISSIMKKASTSTIITFVILLMILPIISMALSISVDVWWMLDQASNAISYILPGNKSALDLMQIPVPSVFKESLVMVAWGLVSSVAAYILFKRREF